MENQPLMAYFATFRDYDHMINCHATTILRVLLGTDFAAASFSPDDTALSVMSVKSVIWHCTH